MQWVYGIFDASVFIPRDHCGQWGPWDVYAQLFDLVIFFAYMLIPLRLLYLVRHVGWWKRIPALSFCCFIMFCGLGHLCDLLAFHWPAYRFFTLVDCGTAVASIAVAFHAPLLVDMLLSTNPKRGGG